MEKCQKTNIKKTRLSFRTSDEGARRNPLRENHVPGGFLVAPLPSKWQPMTGIAQMTNDQWPMTNNKWPLKIKNHEKFTLTFNFFLFPFAFYPGTGVCKFLTYRWASGNRNLYQCRFIRFHLAGNRHTGTGSPNIRWRSVWWWQWIWKHIRTGW